MIHTRGRAPVQGGARVWLLLWTVLVLVGVFLLWRQRRRKASPPEPPELEAVVRVDPARWGELAVTLTLRPASGPVEWTVRWPWRALTVRNTRGGALPWRRLATGVRVEAPPGGTVRLAYRVPAAHRRGPYHDGVATPVGAVVPLGGVLFRPEGSWRGLTLRVEAPPAVHVFLPAGAGPRGWMPAAAVDRGALAWAAGGYEALLPPPTTCRCSSSAVPAWVIPSSALCGVSSGGW